MSISDRIRLGLAQAYHSPLGRPMSALGRAIAALKRPRMIYGMRDPASGEYRKYTRMSDTVTFLQRPKLSVEDHVWVWHHSILDASEGLHIGEGCQIGAWVGIFTHGSQISIRLYGREYIHVPNRQRAGYVRGPVRINPYTFIGAASLIMPGVTIGEGCLIGANSVVTKDVPDGSIAVGTPAKVVGSTEDLDREYLATGDFDATYYKPALVDRAESTGAEPSSAEP